MGTPEEVLPNSTVYFQVYFAGSIFFVMYNIFVGILQAVGDSRHPLYYLIISSITNVILDLIFVAGFHFGVHLHPATVRTTFKMFGDDRICLISDSMMATGLSDGDYSLGGQPVKVVGNLATLADGTIAGSATNLMDCMRIAVKKMGIPLGSAVKCAAVNPAKAIGIYDTYGSITPGKKANIVLLDQDLNMKHLIFKGELQK